LLKPECISPATERQRARAPRSAGISPEPGLISARYSAIANVSQIFRPSWVRQGTRNDGDSSNSSARVDGSSLETGTSSNSIPAILQSSQPRSDHEP